jgi:hypothetical protein
VHPSAGTLRAVNGTDARVIALDYIAGGLAFVLVAVSLGLLYGAAGFPLPRRRSLAAGAAIALAATAVLDVSAIPATLRALAMVVAGLIVARVARGRPGAWKLAIALAVATALTVAQPLGVRAVPIDASAAQSGRTVDPSETHRLDVLGVPVLAFRFYRRERFDPLAAIGECCPPTHTLRVRSWLVPGLLTHATELEQLCGDRPCWEPGETAKTSSLQLQEASAGWHATLGGARDAPPPQRWRLAAGIASPAGAAYWTLAAIGIVAVVRRQRRRAERPE